MPKYIYNRKKWILRLSLAAVLVMLGFNLQDNLMQVSAQVVPITVNYNHLDFSRVFPGEKLDRDFTVTSSAVGTDAVAYKIIQKRKPLSTVSVPPGYSGTLSQYCQEFPENYEYCYRNLCPYITEISLENESDASSSAKVGPVGADLSDTWLVKLDVPAIIGNVAQDHNGGLVNEAGDYGCDISIDVDEDADQPPAGGFYMASSNGTGAGRSTAQNFKSGPAVGPNAPAADTADGADTGEINATPGADPDPVIVAGAELVPTGFRNDEFAVLCLLLAGLFLSVRSLKKIKY